MNKIKPFEVDICTTPGPVILLFSRSLPPHSSPRGGERECVEVTGMWEQLDKHLLAKSSAISYFFSPCPRAMRKALRRRFALFLLAFLQPLRRQTDRTTNRRSCTLIPPATVVILSNTTLQPGLLKGTFESLMTAQQRSPLLFIPLATADERYEAYRTYRGKC